MVELDEIYGKLSENPCVAGSIPALGTIFFNILHKTTFSYIAFWLAFSDNACFRNALPGVMKRWKR